MRIIKLDRRHKGYGEYAMALQFSKIEFRRMRKHWPYRDALKQLYGEETTYDSASPADRMVGKWEYNEHYYIDRVKYRINVKDAEAITLLQLMIS